jgi:hypothetical protein
MNDIPLILAGFLATLAAAVHGAGGEIWVVRKLTLGNLPSTRFGGAAMTKAMIHVTWHIATVGFLTAGVALLLAGSVLDGDAAQALGVVSAAAFTGFAVVALGLAAAHTRFPRSMLSHPGPVAIAATAALAWWGVL